MLSSLCSTAAGDDWTEDGVTHGVKHEHEGWGQLARGQFNTDSLKRLDQ